MKIPDFKKRISFFLSSEEAKALKKNIAKFGLTAAIAAGIMVQNEPAQAGGTHIDSAHDDGHNDYNSHTDYGHNDSTVHTDGHSDSAHGDGCVDGGYPHSSQPVYDTTNKRGGHSSHSQHDSC